MKKQTTALVAAAVLLLAALVPYTGATAPPAKSNTSLGKAAFNQRPLIETEEPEPICPEESTSFTLAWQVVDEAALFGIDRRVVFSLEMTDPLTQQLLGKNTTEVVYHVTPFNESSGAQPLTVTLHLQVVPRSILATVAVQVFDGPAITPAHFQAQNLEIDFECRLNCPEIQPNYAAMPAADPGAQTGLSDWTLGVLAPCIATPTLPVWTDLGSITTPYRVWFTGDTEDCTKNTNGWNGWEFSFTIHAELKTAFYHGELPFDLGTSTIMFPFTGPKFSEKHSGKWDGMGFDDTERTACEAQQGVAKARANATAYAWVNEQLAAKVVPGSIGQVNMLIKANGQPTFSTGPMPGTCLFSMEVLRGWSFNCDFVVLTTSGPSIVSNASGRSLFTQPAGLV